MITPAKKKNIILELLSLLCFSFLLCFGTNSYALMIDATKIKEISIYGQSSGYGQSLYPGSLVFNVTNTSTISSMISSIEFSTERDCSAMGATSNARMYIKFADTTIEIYDLFGLYSHISKLGLWGSCYYISEQGQSLFETNTQ